jgi:uncharacterized protein
MLMPPTLHVSLLPDDLAVCQFPPGTVVDPPDDDSVLWSVTSTPDEVSVMCPTAEAPEGATHMEPGWRAFKVAGPLQFDLVGVLASLLQPLVEARVSVFAISTFETDYILVRSKDVRTAATALRIAGHTVEGASSGARPT